MVTRFAEAFSQDFVETRLAAACYYRSGDSGAVVRLIAAAVQSRTA